MVTFFLLLITFAKCLDPDQDGQNMVSDLDCVRHSNGIIPEVFFKINSRKKIQATKTKFHLVVILNSDKSWKPTDQDSHCLSIY